MCLFAESVFISLSLLSRDHVWFLPSRLFKSPSVLMMRFTPAKLFSTMREKLENGFYIFNFFQSDFPSIAKQGKHTKTLGPPPTRRACFRVCAAAAAAAAGCCRPCACVACVAMCSPPPPPQFSCALHSCNCRASSLASVGACEMEMGVGDSGAISSVLPDEVR